MPLIVQPRKPFPARVDASECIHSHWAKRTTDDIEDLPLWIGNRRERLGEYLILAGDPGEPDYLWDGDFSQVDHLGASMSYGRLRIQGSAGHDCGRQLQGGLLEVDGSVQDFCGMGMSHGTIRVRGSAGHRVGGCRDESGLRMTGGEIFVEGSAGKECGYRMRRGLIAIGGDCQELCGYQLYAGTIVIGGRYGEFVGLGMRRGTIVIRDDRDLRNLPYVSQPSHTQLLLRNLLQVRLQELGFFEARRHEEPNLSGFSQTAGELTRIYHADLLEGARGEIICWP